MDSSLLVETSFGLVKGIQLDDGINAWLGIPFAEPPLGNEIWSQFYTILYKGGEAWCFEIGPSFALLSKTKSNKS